MIYATVNMTVGDYSSTCDQNIVLYRGDKNVEIRFVIKGNRFTVLDSTYAQMIIRRPSSVSIFSEPAAIQNDTVVFTISEDMIDELKEIGAYTFQVRLYDNSMNARATLPPCEGCLIINQPIATEGEALVNAAMINDSAVLAAAYSDVPEDEIFDNNNAYNRTVWVDGDIITDVRMNKIENALYYINEKGGGGTATAPYISTSLPETVMVGSGEDFELDLDFSSPNLGKGTLKVFINDVDSMNQKIDQGISITAIPGSLFSKGTNMVVIYVLDRVGMMSNSLTFYVRYGGTEVTSTFDAYVSYDYGATVRYYFTPTALDTSLQLTFYMEIDGTTQAGVPCISDVRSYYTFPTNLSVGNHYCRAWVTDGTTRSNVLTFNLIILDATSLVVATDTLNPTVEEGTQLVLDYKVYMKNNTSFITKTYVDNNLINTGTCTLETAYYRTTTLTAGTHTIKVEVFDVTETYTDFVTWTVTVTESTYTMLEPAKAGSTFMATAYNKSNVDENREVWIGSNQDDDDITASLSNFSFNSENGWIDDALVISGNSWVEIPIQPLANNAQYGFTLDIEFKTKAIGVEDAEVLTLWNETDNCGIKITTEQLIMRSKTGNQCDLYFAEDEIVSAIFVIDRDEKTAKIYLNGVMCEAFALSDYEAAGQKFLEDFTVNSNVYLGGYNKNGYCAIKNIRIYEVALATNEILNNFMSNEKDKAAQRELVEFQKGNTLPTLTIYCDFSGLGKDDKKPCNIVYNSPDVNLYGESFTLDGKHSMLQYQGTSSMQYPIKNYRINPRNADGKVKLDPFNNGVGESRFTLKADFMSSGHWQNTGMAKFVNDCLYNYNPNDEKSMNPAKWWSLQNGGSLKDTRETINGFPCRLILVNDGETALNEGQQEPTPGNTKDMGIFNFNNDKDNVNTLGLDTEIFPNCISYEVTANSDTSAGAFVPYEGDYDEAEELSYLQNSFELRYPDEDDVGKDYGYLGLIVDKPHIEREKNGGITNAISIEYFGTRTLTITTGNGMIFHTQRYGEDMGRIETTYNHKSGSTVTLPDNVHYIKLYGEGCSSETITINGVEYIMKPILDNAGFKDPHMEPGLSKDYGLKRVIDWVGNCTNEEFKADFEKYFNKQYVLRYYLLVIVCGMVDNLGKNMMLDTWDGQIWYPRFYDMDTICSYDNSGEIKFDVDIEMAQGYWNTSSSRLWTKVRDLFHDELVETYNNMRQNNFSYEKFMSYFYDKQIAQIPQTYYNKDYDVKYAPYANEYMGKAHGDGYEHLKRWLKRRLIFTDTLFDYAPSYTNDALTIRANTLDLMSLEIETYTPVYQHVSFYNGNMEKIKIDGKVSTTFTGTAQTATDQEVLIYGGSNIKSIKGIQSMNPNSMLIGNATKLTQLDISNCPILTVVNSNKANFSPHTYLNKLDISNCPQLGGQLNISNSPLLQELNALGSAVDSILFPTSVRNLETLRVPKTVNNLTLTDAGLLYTIEMEEGNNLQNISLTNCNNLTETINFDLTKTPTVLLDNSYDAEEIYMSATTNLTLKNMPSLKRVIFTPNSEYSAFDINNVLNGANYKITTFNNPMMTDFITTAPHRDSYNGDDVEWVDKEAGQYIEFHNVVKWVTDFTPNGEEFRYDISGRVNFNNKEAIIAEIDLSTCSDTSSGGENILSIGYNVRSWNNSNTCHCYYRCSTKEIRIDYLGYEYGNITLKDNTKVVIILCADGIFINDNLILKGSQLEQVLSQEYLYVASSEGSGRSHATYKYIGECEYEIVPEIIQVKDYGDITPNTAFTANTLDLADTQFQNVKFLCTTDIYNLKVPTTMKNFYCDSAMDIDTDVIEDASYEVIHEKLIEPYTTNYEKNVYGYEEIFEVYYRGDSSKWIQYKAYNQTTGEITDGYESDCITVDYFQVSPNTTFSIGGGGYSCAILEYSMDKTFIKATRQQKPSVTLSPNTYFVRGYCQYAMTVVGYDFTYQRSYTPNIIPSSANGSLIFNMYSNNTTQPTSTSPYMWDLTGLKLEDFYTYGMNNWVKPSEDSYVNLLDTVRINKWYYTGYGGGSGNYNGCLPPITFPEDVTTVTLTSDDNIYFCNQTGDASATEQSAWSKELTAKLNSTYRTLFISSTTTSNPTWIKLTCDNGVIYMIDFDGIERVDITSQDECLALGGNVEDIAVKTLSEIKSITMPQRMSGYSVRLVNADITPDEYPTMLYPKLIDTTLPITGKLDYTAYNGISLAWAYAYTTGDVSINPLDSRNQGNITQDYNKLYGTDFVDNVDVWAYKDDDFSSKSTNEAITKAYIELTSTNYTTRVDEVLQWYPNCTDLYLFEDGNMTALNSLFYDGNKTHKDQIQNVIFMDGYFEKVTTLCFAFDSCPNLKSVNGIPNSVQNMARTFGSCSSLTHISNLPTSLKYFDYCFSSCTSFNQQLDLSEMTLNNEGLVSTFMNCSALTTAPILPNTYNGSMQSTFHSCTSLTQAPTIPQGVTNLNDCFNGCTSLTEAPVIPQGVTNMSSTFNGCTSLTEAPVIPDSVTDMSSCFKGCTSLATGATFEGTACKIRQLYRGCTNLISCSLPLGGKDYLNSYSDCVWSCTALTSITWLGEINISFIANYLVHDSLPIETVKQAISDLIPEHLATKTATVTMGTYISYLSEDEIAGAVAKGWTIQE